MIEGPQTINSLDLATQQKTKISIFNYVASGSNYYFTLCEKKPENVGFNHPRLLVFEEVQGIIYYVNNPDKWPLKDTVISTPKNQKVILNLCELKNQSGNELNITYTKKSDKDKVVPGQWVFVMDTKNVAKQWVNFVYAKKNERVAKAIQNSPANKQQQIIQDPLISTNYKNEDKNTLQQNADPKFMEESMIKKTGTLQSKQENKNMKQSNSSYKVNAPVEENKVPQKGLNSSSSFNKNSSQINNTRLSNKPVINSQYNDSGRDREPDKGLNMSISQPYEQPKPNLKSEIKDTNQKGSTISAVNNKPVNESSYKNTGNSQSYAPSRHEPESAFKKQDPKKTNPPIMTNQERSSNFQERASGYQGRATNAQEKPNVIQNRSSTFQEKPSTIQDRNSAVKESGKTFNNEAPKMAKKQSSNYKNQGGEKIDWNLEFLQNRTERTIKKFNLFCLENFLALNPETITLRAETQSRDEEVMPRKFVRESITLYMAQYGTKAAQNLRRQYKNYHFILESCKEVRIIHVPLTCLIQHLGIICLAKANFAEPYEVIDLVTNSDSSIEQQLRSLETFTKISSETLRKWGNLCNLTKRYGKQGKYDRIYVDNLNEYLPRNPECSGSAVRPELILQNITKTLHPKNAEYQNQISKVLQSSLQKIADILSQHELIIASYDDLRQIIHDFGLNNGMLPMLYNSVRSRFVKRYLYTAMLASLAKQDIIMSMTELRESQKLNRLIDGIQEIFRIYFEAHLNDPAYVQLWKSQAQQFRKKYRINFNLNEIEPGFFLSSIMSIIHGDYDIQKIDKSKTLLTDKDIIGKGFILQLKPIIKGYSNYLTERNMKLVNLCKYPINNVNDVSSIMTLSDISSNINQKQRKQIFARLSSIISPYSSENKELISDIYSVTNQQPPCLTSHSTTISFADHCQKEGKLEQYKRTVEKAVDVINYWLGDEHMLLCDVFQSLADYYEVKGQPQDCINYMKQSLTTCIRQTGTHTNRVGLQYFKLAQKQLKYGQNKDALQNYYKFKTNVETGSHKSVYYPVGLMRIGNLQLSQGQIEKCIGLCIKAIRSSQQIQAPDSTMVKVYDLLSRAYQLNQNRQQLLNLAHLTAKIFNSTNSPFAFDQMIRICIVGFIGALQPGRQDKLNEYIRINRQVLEQRRKPKEATNRLMDAANSYIVMERFFKGFEEIDKYISEIKHNRHQSGEAKQFRFIFQSIVHIVGLDFVEGILRQAQYW